MNGLIICESSGVVREAFRRLGHNFWSCDLLPADDGSPHHIQGDMKDAVHKGDWDFIGAHLSCTYLCGSGLHWNKRDPARAAKTESALDDVRWFFSVMEDRKIKGYLENPVGVISTRIRWASQYIQPYEFGHDASKKTGLWLFGLPHLKKNPANFVAPRIVEWGPGSGKMKKRWSNQTDSGQNRLPPSENRWKERSRTYDGIANAMAEQWGSAK